MNITRMMLETIEGVRIEDCSRDAREYIEAVEIAMDAWLYWVTTERRALSVSDDDMSTLVGDAGLPHADAWRSLLLDAGYTALRDGWSPNRREDIAYRHGAGLRRAVISYSELSELLIAWDQPAMSPVLIGSEK